MLLRMAKLWSELHEATNQENRVLIGHESDAFCCTGICGTSAVSVTLGHPRRTKPVSSPIRPRFAGGARTRPDWFLLIFLHLLERHPDPQPQRLLIHAQHVAAHANPGADIASIYLSGPLRILRFKRNGKILKRSLKSDSKKRR